MNAVIDANALANFFLDHPKLTPAVEQALQTPGVVWHAPELWRSELRSTFMQYVQSADESIPGTALTLSDAVAHMADAEIIVAGTHRVDSEAVLRMADSADHSPYDCEYVQLAVAMNTQLVTYDCAVLAKFPDVAVAPADFGA